MLILNFNITRVILCFAGSICVINLNLQIIKLLTSFKPTDDCEERISMDFIRKVKDKLEERPECQDKVIFTSHSIFFRFCVYPL